MTGLSQHWARVGLSAEWTGARAILLLHGQHSGEVIGLGSGRGILTQINSLPEAVHCGEDGRELDHKPTWLHEDYLSDSAFLDF